MIEDLVKEKIENLEEKLNNGEGLTMKLPKGSVLHMDRPLPFVCIYQYPENIKKSAHAKLLETQPSYFLIHEDDLNEAVKVIEFLGERLAEKFGAFLFLELWSSDSEKSREEMEQKDILFHIFCSQKECKASMSGLKEQLSSMMLPYPYHRAGTHMYDEEYPRHKDPVVHEEVLNNPGIQYVGMEIIPFYLNPDSKQLYPMLYRTFRSKLATILRRTFYDFVRLQTRLEVAHYHNLGRQRENELVWKVDRELAEINNSFDFLLLVDVTNADEEWEKFKNCNYEEEPKFRYRLIPVDPDLLKRQLFNIPIEQIEDPTLAYLFRDKRDELDRMLNMLIERDTSHFKYSSMQVFGRVKHKMLKIAEDILINTNNDTVKEQRNQRILSAEEFAELGRREIEFLKKQHPEVDAKVYVRKDISSLMVSKGQLLIGHNFSTTEKRAEALIQHEVGTHVLTYYNGKVQPLQLLYLGTPGYEDLQEGIAVLAEYLVGGLSASRLITLAARVVAVFHMTEGASFVDTFRILTRDFGLRESTAFSIVTRVYRGGGFTKDAVYLKGLVHLLKYLKEGNDLKPLLIGKIKQEYIDIIKELQERRILKPMPLIPRYFYDQDSMNRLKELNKEKSVYNLINF